MKYLFIILCILILNIEIQADEAGRVPNGWLKGKVITYNSNRKEIPLVGRKIHITYNNGAEKNSTKINEVGDFRFNIKNMIYGKKIKITIEGGRDYFILYPYNGEMFPPESLKSYQLNIVVISNDSKVQTGSFYANFKNRDRKRASKIQGYTVQVLATHSWTTAVNVESFFRNNNSFKECENNLCRVYVSFSKNRKDAINLKNRIKRDFKKQHKYQDIFVRSILH